MPGLREKLLGLYEAVNAVPQKGAEMLLDAYSNLASPSHAAPSFEKAYAPMPDGRMEPLPPYLEAGFTKVGMKNFFTRAKFMTRLNTNALSRFDMPYNELPAYERAIAFIETKYPKLFEKATRMGGFNEDDVLGGSNMAEFRGYSQQGPRAAHFNQDSDLVLSPLPGKPARGSFYELFGGRINMDKSAHVRQSFPDLEAANSLPHEMNHWWQLARKPVEYSEEMARLRNVTDPKELWNSWLEMQARQGGRTGEQTYLKFLQEFPEMRGSKGGAANFLEPVRAGLKSNSTQHIGRWE